MERTPINPTSTTHAQARWHCKDSATLGRRVGSYTERDLRCFTSAQLGSLDRTHTEQVTTGQTTCRQRHPLHHCVAGGCSKIVRWHKDHAWYHCSCVPAPWAQRHHHARLQPAIHRTNAPSVKANILPSTLVTPTLPQNIPYGCCCCRMMALPATAASMPPLIGRMLYGHYRPVRSTHMRAYGVRLPRKTPLPWL